MEKKKAGKAAYPKSLHVNFVLQGDEVIRFLDYKAGAFLRNNSEAGRKLMLERLHQIGSGKAEPATT